MDKEKQEPLLADSQDSDVVWQGTTWQGCPGFPCLAPLFCSTWTWRITTTRIDLEHGCCGNDVDCLDLRRVIDIHFHRSIFQMCLNRGTITIHSSNDEMPQLQLTTFGTKQLYHDLKEAWSRAKVATAVDADHHAVHA